VSKCRQGSACLKILPDIFMMLRSITACLSLAFGQNQSRRMRDPMHDSHIACVNRA
jgi:hypothetical protein